MKKTRYFIFLLLLILSTAISSISAETTGDNNVLWDWLYHAPNTGNPATEAVPGQATDKYLNISGTTVTIYALADAGDLTLARVRYWDTSEHFADMSKVSTTTHNGRSYDVWKATITGAATSGTTYYYILAQDGTHNAYLKKNNGNQAGGYTNPLGQFIRNPNVTDGDYTFTAQAGPSNTVAAPAVSADKGTSGTFNITLTNSEALTGGNIVLQYDATKGVTLSATGATSGGSGAATTLTVPVGTVAANAGKSFTVNYTVSSSATPTSFPLDITAATTLTGGTVTPTLTDGTFTITDPTVITTNRDVYVQLFEWKWNDIAKECTFLAAKGFKGVQISPPHEHIVPPAANSYPWWARYQAVSYKLDTSRSGTKAELQSMINTCNAAGIDVVADIILNHTTGAEFNGTGVAGSSFNGGTKSFPAIGYTSSHFHPTCTIQSSDYTGNAANVRNCGLLSLLDLDTAQSFVQDKIAAYMNELLTMGVKGFRLDAAKHMAVSDIQAIKSRLTNPNVFIFSEVIDTGGQAIASSEYTGIGYVTEFKYQNAMGTSFSTGCSGPNLSWLSGITTGKLPTGSAIVFTNNHDSQRGHGAGGPCVIDYRDGDGVYNIAQAFMLAHPYGRPVLMSSYHWDGMNDNAGPPTVNGPAGSSGETKPVYGSSQAAGATPQFCDSTNWVCEHRRPSHANMVGFRNNASGQAVTNWWDNGGNKIAFGRNGKGFISINRDGSAHSRTYATGMPAGKYCDAMHGERLPDLSGCTGPVIEVDASGNATFAVNGMDAVAFYQKISDVTIPTVSITAPASGAVLTQTFSVNATAAIVGSTITSVEFYVDDQLVGTDTTSPYSFSINPTSYTNGAHVLKAKAIAATGTSNSATVNVTFDPPVPPVVDITHPANGATVTGTFPVTATASHFSGIQKVDFYVDGTLVGTDTTPASSPLAGDIQSAEATNAISVTVDGFATEWTSAQLIATAPAHDSAQVAAPCTTGTFCNNGHTWSVHERQVDFIALYATWDASNIYFGVQGADVIDVVDPSNANSGDPTYTWDGGLMFIAVDTRSGGYSTGGDMWNKPQTFTGTDKPDYQIYFSHSFWQGGPFVREHNGTAWATATAPATGQTHASVGLQGKSRASFVAGTPVKGNHNGNANYDFVANGHNTGRNGFYELKVPLAFLGSPDLNNGCIKVLVANSHSAIDSLPKDPTTLNTPGASDSNSPLEWSDTDAFTVPFIKIGNGTNCSQAVVGNAYSINLNAANYTPGTHTIEARATANNGLIGSDTSTFVISGTVVSPVVTVTAPISGSTQTGTFTASATATISTGTISKVEFFVDNVLVSTDTTSPYSASINAANYAAGGHVLKVVATGSNGQTTQKSVNFTVSSPNQLKLTVGDYAVTAGTNVTFTSVLTITNNATPGIGALNVELTYNPAVLEPVSCTVDPNSKFDAENCNLVFDNNNVGTDIVKMNFVSTAGASGNLTIARVVFQAIGAAGTNSVLGLNVPTIANPSGTTLAMSRDEGTATITPSGFVKGDVNCDGTVNTVDALFIGQYDVGLRTASTVCPLASGKLYLPACDVNNDGNCNVVDQLFVMQCDVNVGNSFCPALQNVVSLVDSADSGASHVTLRTGPVQVDGDLFVVPVVAAPDGDVAAISAKVHYDSDKVSVVACTTDAGWDAGLCSSDVPGELSFNAVAVAGRTGDVGVTTLTFQARPGVSADSLLDLSVSVASSANGVLLSADAIDSQLCPNSICAPTAIHLDSQNTTNSSWLSLFSLSTLVVLALATLSVYRKKVA